MWMLDDFREQSRRTFSKENQKLPKARVQQSQKIQMPIRPPESGGSAVAEVRVSAMPRGTNQLWIAVEDVEWLINYVGADDTAPSGKKGWYTKMLETITPL